jgi:peptidoglycan/LPS O-acetylase OafA/YrhL
LWSEAGYFDKASELKPLLHLWSLGIEEQFYVVWPLLLWAGWRLRIPLLLIVASVGLASFVMNLVGVHENPTATFYSPLSRGWELIVGAALACLTSDSGTKTISRSSRLTAIASTFALRRYARLLQLSVCCSLFMQCFGLKTHFHFQGSGHCFQR